MTREYFFRNKTRHVLLLAMVLVSPVILLVAQNPDVERFYTLTDTAWAFRSIARPQDDGIVADDEGYDMSMEAIEARSQFWEGIERSLDSIDVNGFEREDRINFEVFRYIVSDHVAHYQYSSYFLPFNAEGGFHSNLAFEARRTLRTEGDIEKYISRLRRFAKETDQQIALMREAIIKGYTMPCPIIQGFDETALSYVADDPTRSIFWAPVSRSESLLDTLERSLLEKDLAECIINYVNPTYRKLADFLREEYIPSCRTAVGVSELPNGSAYYAQRIRYFTTLDMTPKEVFDIGTSEVARIKAEMQEIIAEVGFKGTFAEFLDFLRTDPRFYAETPHDLLSAASYHAKRIDGLLPSYFGRLPRLTYGIAPVPEEIAPRYTGGRYVPGDAKNGRSGTYWVNTYKLESRPLYVLPSLTLHEAVPGHHLQISLASELQDLPDFRSNYYISAFGEGWALYTEFLGNEMGIYETPYQRFGALTYEMWRACRLVVDPGMHVLGWSRDEAVEFMAANTALSIHEINTEINRYIGWPGQAVSYKIGELKIRELRKRAEERLGERFDLRSFHDTILENGSLPLFVLEMIVDEWIASEVSK